MPIKRYVFLIALLLSSLTPASASAQDKDQGLSLSDLKTYLHFATALNCQPRAKGDSLYASLARSGNAFAILLAQKNGGAVENNKLNVQQAKNFFSNELAIQLLKACPSRLSASEKANIEAMQAEILKRKNSR